MRVVDPVVDDGDLHALAAQARGGPERPGPDQARALVEREPVGVARVDLRDERELGEVGQPANRELDRQAVEDDLEAARDDGARDRLRISRAASFCIDSSRERYLRDAELFTSSFRALPPTARPSAKAAARGGMPRRTITRIRPLACCAGMRGGALSLDADELSVVPAAQGLAARTTPLSHMRAPRPQRQGSDAAQDAQRFRVSSCVRIAA